MTGSASAPDLLAMARTVLDDSPRSLRVDRTAAAALLVRQALEVAVGQVWADRVPEMAATTDRAQQITLAFYVDSDLGDQVSWAWARLSHLCHHTAYEMPPSVAEVRDLIDVVERLAGTAAPST